MAGVFDEAGQDEDKTESPPDDLVEVMKCYGVRVDKKEGEVFGGGGKISIDVMGEDGEKVPLTLFPGEVGWVPAEDITRINAQSVHFDRLVKPGSQVEGEKIRPGQRKQTPIQPVDFDSSM